jgi:foldase protein PrsA
MSKKFNGWLSGKTGLAVLALILALFALTACGGDEPAKDDKQKTEEQKQEDTKKEDTKKEDAAVNKPADLPEIVAEYKGGTVKKAEFQTFMQLMRFLNPEYQETEKQPKYMEQLVEAYISYGVARDKVDPSLIKDMNKEVEQQISSIQEGMTQSFGPDGFNKRLKEFNLSKTDLNNYLQDRFHMMKYVTSRVSDSEVKNEYDSRAKKGEMKQTLATVSHILIGLNEGQPNQRTKEEALKIAKDVLVELKGGADFAAAAKKYSDDPGSKDKGGTYEDADVEEWVPEFKEAAKTLKLNTISEPVETQYGYHIMKVSKRSEKTKTFTEIEEELRGELSQNEFIAIMQNEVQPLITKNNVK